MAGEDGGSSNGNVGCTDIISGLPDEIRECILGYLPISDAVRTSVLSHKWRYSWTRATQLNIQLDAHMENDLDYSPELYCALVGRILLYHVGPIHTFVLRFSYRDCERMEDVNSWLQFVSRNGIKDLRLLGDEYIDCLDLPQSIFRCVGLSCLTLDKVALKYSLPFRGFPNLVRLVLTDVEGSGDVLEKIISSSLTLEVLIIKRCCFRSDGRSDTAITISAPNLRVLEVACEVFGLNYIDLKHTPNLKVASFTIEQETGELDLVQSNCFDVLRSMPKIEVLTFECRLHKTSSSDVILKKLPESLVNLKTVSLDLIYPMSVDEMSLIFCIISSSPNLQTLDIHVISHYIYFVKPYINKKSFCKDSMIAAAAYLDDLVKEEIKSSLVTLSVTISYDETKEYIRALTDLIVSIVSCCPSLEKLIIKSWNIQSAKKLRISRTLRRFGRSSSKPKIIYATR